MEKTFVKRLVDKCTARFQSNEGGESSFETAATPEEHKSVMVDYSNSNVAS